MEVYFNCIVDFDTKVITSFGGYTNYKKNNNENNSDNSTKRFDLQFYLHGGVYLDITLKNLIVVLIVMF